MGGRDKPNRDRGPGRYEGCRERELTIYQAIVPDPNGVGHGQYSADSVGGRAGKASILKKLCILSRLPWYCWASQISIRATAAGLPRNSSTKDDLLVPRLWKFGSLHVVITPLFHANLNIHKTDDSSSRDNSIILDVISSRSASIDTVWKSVFLIIPKSAEWYLCNETSDRQIKHFLETSFLSRFFYFISFWT